MYTMLVGKPPFETSSLKETYQRIKDCEYIIPGRVGIFPRLISIVQSCYGSMYNYKKIIISINGDNCSLIVFRTNFIFVVSSKTLSNKAHHEATRIFIPFEIDYIYIYKRSINHCSLNHKNYHEFFNSYEEDKVGSSAQHLITSMLHAQSKSRPKIKEILIHEFITVGYLPKSLPR